MTEPPVRTPAGSAKSLQLTLIWEEVVRNQRVPPDVAMAEVLREIRGRLRAGEWEVRQHALRVLADVLPIAGELADPAELQVALVVNLGSPAPGVRKAAREALGRLLQNIKNPEQDILNLLGGCNDENVTLGIIIALPDLLKPLIFPANGGHVLSSHCLTAILTYLVNKVSTPIYRDASVDALLKIRDMCGEVKFQRCLEDISPDPKTLQLLTLNLDDSGIDLKLPRPRDRNPDFGDEVKIESIWSDYSDGDGDENLENSVTTYHNYGLLKRDGSSEDMGSDGSDDTYTMESTESGKVVLETEIRLSEEKAITMRIMEEDSVEVEEGAEGRFVSADGALVMSVVPSSDEDARRTPRRVRFGGEVVKLCTPDSDGTDVRIEIQDAAGHAIERMVIERAPRPSQIPLPISPATSVPQAPSPATSVPHAPSENPRVHAVPLQHNGHVENNIASAPIKEDDPQERTLPKIEVEIVDTEQLQINPSPPVQDDTQETAASSSQSLPASVTHNDFQENSSSADKPPAPVDASDQPPLPERPRTATGRNRGDSSFTGVAVSPQEMISEFSSDWWSWESLGLLNESDMHTLRNKDDWKEELAVLEQLPRNLMSGDVQARLQAANVDTVRALLRCLLEYSKPQTAEAALCAVGQVVHMLQDATAQACLPELVSGVCRYVGGSAAVAVKMTAANVLRLLFSRQNPSDILQVLLSRRCLHSPSSKMRENSLLVLLHALMTFPSTTFPPRTVLLEGCRSAADPRRRVRHAALETLAVLAQFLPAQEILECASKHGDERLVSAVSTRLTRRSLPSVSADGLVLYALQIPSARRLGHTGPPQGADVDWILAGTGSLSTGSARSRGQLQAAQASRWGTDSNVVRKAARENPWTAQKHRTEDALAWALVPMADMDEGGYGGAEGSYLPMGMGMGGMRPYYVKLAQPDDPVRSQRYVAHRVADVAHADASIRVLTPSVLRKRTESKPSPWTDSHPRAKETTELRRMERVVGRKVVDGPRSVLMTNSPVNNANTPPAALFLPSIHPPDRQRQDQNSSGPDRQRQDQYSSGPDRQRQDQYSSGPDRQRQEHFSATSDRPRDYSAAPERLIQENISPVASERHLQEHLPERHAQERYSTSSGSQEYFSSTPDKPRFVEPVVSAQLSNLAGTPQSLSQSLPAVPRALDSASPIRPPPPPSADMVDTIALSNDARLDSQEKIFRARERALEHRVSMASAPPAITSTTRESSSSSSTSDTLPAPHRDSVVAPLEVTSTSYRSLNESYNQKVKAKRKQLGGTATGKVGPGPTGQQFPDTLKPFERPKEGLDTCFSQLDALQWEVTVQGLTSLVRLVRHHPAAACAHIHALSVALARHIRNLRSQVSRVACVVATEMFTLLKRAMEPELEEVAGALFHRVADTNRFIRADSNAALDAMVDSMSPLKAVPIVLGKGAAHLNAVTRTSAARLLLRLAERLGPDKMLALPRETRDKMLQASAGLLTEGRLETRTFAKQLFRIWSSHPEFGGIMLEAVPANIMRQISKTLASLRA